MRGYFVSLEGVEGCGKTTQATRLQARLSAAGFAVTLVREPGGTRLGEALRAILLDPAVTDLNPWAEANLYTAARAQLVREVILPRLARADVVIADRFADSTIAYQGHGRGLDATMLAAMQGVLKIRPDVTFLLDLPAVDGAARQRAAGHAPDRMEQEDPAFHERVREGYLALAGKDPDRFRVVDAARDPEAVAQELEEVTMRRIREHGLSPVA